MLFWLIQFLITWFLSFSTFWVLRRPAARLTGIFVQFELTKISAYFWLATTLYVKHFIRVLNKSLFDCWVFFLLFWLRWAFFTRWIKTFTFFARWFWDWKYFMNARKALVLNHITIIPPYSLSIYLLFLFEFKFIRQNMTLIFRGNLLRCWFTFRGIIW